MDLDCRQRPPQAVGTRGDQQAARPPRGPAALGTCDPTPLLMGGRLAGPHHPHPPQRGGGQGPRCKQVVGRPKQVVGRPIAHLASPGGDVISVCCRAACDTRPHLTAPGSHAARTGDVLSLPGAVDVEVLLSPWLSVPVAVTYFYPLWGQAGRGPLLTPSLPKHQPWGPQLQPSHSPQSRSDTAARSQAPRPAHLPPQHPREPPKP